MPPQMESPYTAANAGTLRIARKFLGLQLDVRFVDLGFRRKGLGFKIQGLGQFISTSSFHANLSPEP